MLGLLAAAPLIPHLPAPVEDFTTDGVLFKTSIRMLPMVIDPSVSTEELVRWGQAFTRVWSDGETVLSETVSPEQILLGLTKKAEND